VVTNVNGFLFDSPPNPPKPVHEDLVQGSATVINNDPDSRAFNLRKYHLLRFSKKPEDALETENREEVISRSRR
jgi:hypothetical protein